LFYLVLIHYFIFTWPAQAKNRTYKNVSLFKCFEQTPIFPVKTHIMRIRCHFDATILIYKHFAVFLKSDTHRRSKPSRLDANDCD